MSHKLFQNKRYRKETVVGGISENVQNFIILVNTAKNSLHGNYHLDLSIPHMHLDLWSMEEYTEVKSL